MTKLMVASIKSMDSVGSKVDFSTLILTPRHERMLSRMEVETWALSLDHASRNQSSR